MPRASRHLDLRPRRSPVRTVLSVLGVLLLVAIIGFGVFVYFTGWNALFGDEVAPVHVENVHTPAPEAPPATFIEGGSAEENLPFFLATLQGYAEGSEPIQGEPIVNTVAAAGFDKSAMQVSFDRTETNLVADNIFVSVRVDADCLIGQLSYPDRGAYAVVEPAVGPNQDLCLIGETRPIDW